jgi:hypothetical protein
VWLYIEAEQAEQRTVARVRALLDVSRSANYDCGLGLAESFQSCYYSQS